MTTNSTPEFSYSPSKLEEIARAAAGNWKSFPNFSWCERPDDAEDWVIVYTMNRDGGLLKQSNCAQIEQILEPYLRNDSDDPDIRVEHHLHSIVGWVDGYAIRVWDAETNVTPAFKKWLEICNRLKDYPVLNEEHFSQLEFESAMDGIVQAAWKYDKSIWPKTWQSDLYHWFDENEPHAIENRDGNGAYPSDSEISKAVNALGWSDD